MANPANLAAGQKGLGELWARLRFLLLALIILPHWYSYTGTRY